MELIDNCNTVVYQTLGTTYKLEQTKKSLLITLVIAKSIKQSLNNKQLQQKAAQTAVEYTSKSLCP